MPLGPILGETRIERRLREKAEAKKPVRRQRYLEQLGREQDRVREQYAPEARTILFRPIRYSDAQTTSRDRQIARGTANRDALDNATDGGVFLRKTLSRMKQTNRARKDLEFYINSIAGTNRALEGPPPGYVYRDYAGPPEEMQFKPYVTALEGSRPYFWTGVGESAPEWISQPRFPRRNAEYLGTRYRGTLFPHNQ